MLFKSIDRILTKHALITGRITDIFTGQPIAPVPNVALFFQTPIGAPKQPAPLPLKMKSDGLFAIIGNPESTFNTIQAGDAIDLRLEVRSPGYQEQDINFTLSDLDLATSDEVLTVDSQPITVKTWPAPLVHHDILLSPNPVQLSGRVVDADNSHGPNYKRPGADNCTYCYWACTNRY